uniref:Uncharacterized protein n=1 Tax=Oryza glumipatula TaxID=40148 RepID=A0A0E0BMW4_9ORYZ
MRVLVLVLVSDDGLLLYFARLLGGGRKTKTKTKRRRRRCLCLRLQATVSSFPPATIRWPRISRGLRFLGPLTKPRPTRRAHQCIPQQPRPPPTSASCAASLAGAPPAATSSTRCSPSSACSTALNFSPLSSLASRLRRRRSPSYSRHPRPSSRRHSSARDGMMSSI